MIAAAIIAIAATGVALATVVRRHKTMIPANSVGSVTATCKRGQTALAGGFDSPGFDTSSSAWPVFRFASMPAGKRGIKTSAFNFSDNPGELESFAYCAKRAHALRIKSKRVRLFPGSFGSVVARCPRGRQAVAGGFKTSRFSPSGGALILSFTSKRVGKRGWKVAGLNVGSPGGGSPSGRLIAYAYCQKAGPRVLVRSKTAATTAGGIRNLDVKCPRHRKALSGGFNGHFRFASGGPTAAVAIASKRIARARGWRTTAFGIPSPDPPKITTYVYCGR